MNNLKTINISSLIILFIFTTIGSVKLNSQDGNLQFNNSEFTLSGTVVNDHPALSWNSVPGADYYLLNRAPVPALGSKYKRFNISGNSFIDSAVNGAVLGTGLKKVRYTIQAFDSNDNFIAGGGVVDFTAESID